MIDADVIYQKTDGGRTIIEAYYPQSRESFENPAKKFSIRTEKTPSCAVKQYNGIWFLTDFGDTEKGRNAIQIVMQEEGKTFPEACAYIAARFGIGGVLREEVNKPKIETRQARPDEKEGSKFFEFKPWTEAELACMGPRVTKEHLEAMHWHSVKFIATVKNRKVTYKYSNENYFIFMRECVVPKKPGEAKHEGEFDVFYKIYEPLNAEKKWRFSYYPNGGKPSDYINGLEELKEAWRKLNKELSLDDVEEKKPAKDGASEWDNLERVRDNKVKEVFICSGERDAMCVRSLGYQPVWFNSESHVVDQEEIRTLQKYADQIYNIPDIDETGIEKGKGLALRFITIKTIWLPMELRQLKDNRGRGRKDFRDWIELHQSNAAFKNLISLALPAQFWDVSVDKDGYQYSINLLHTLYFLWLNNFYILKDKDRDDTLFVKINGNVVQQVNGKDIRAFIRDWAEKRALNSKLRNKILDNKKITDQNLEALKEIELDFSNADEKRQLFYFPGCSVEVSKEGCTVFKGKLASELQHYVWEDKVIPHRFRQMDPFFSISWSSEDGRNYDFDIKITDTKSKVLCYLINASRLYWRKEMEDRFGNNEEAISNYRRANRFRIDGDGLDPREIREQKTNLVNKLFTLGYMFYNFKEMARPLAPFLMDYKIGEDNQSNGGSGKSIMFVYVKNFINLLKLSGRDSKLMENPHVFDQVTKETNLVLLDDCYKGMQMGRYYDYITSDLVVNPKNKQSFTIPYKDSPKFAFTTNYVPNDFDPSSERRLLYVTFSDYYHIQTEENDYRQNRTVKDDFGKELFGYDYTEEEWNADINLMLQCTQFYLAAREIVYKINPPMHNIIVRKLKSDIGENFMEWASEKFADVAGNLYINKAINKQELFDNYRLYSNVQKMTATAFKKKLKYFCQYCEWIDSFNPPEVCNTKPDRIIMPDDKGKAAEYVWIRTVSEAERLRKESIDKKRDMLNEKQKLF